MANHPVPAPLDWAAYDRDVLPVPYKVTLPPGTVVISLPSETAIRPDGLELWTGAAAQQRDALFRQILRDRCGLREAAQVANGGGAEPDPVCRPLAKPGDGPGG